MEKREFYYPSADGKTQIHALEWLPETTPVAVLQVAHGVTEYIGRYEAFAEYFAKRGIVVVGNDHLGHGLSISEGSAPMYFGPEGSWNWAVEDVRTCREIMKKKYKDIPYCLLGFSLGSFLVRTYLINEPGTVDASILVGTGQIPLSQISFAKMIAKKEARKFGEDHTSPLIKKLTFGTYNRLFAPNRTDYDWLCASKKSLDEYIADSMRGEYFSAGLFRDLDMMCCGKSVVKRYLRACIDGWERSCILYHQYNDKSQTTCYIITERTKRGRISPERKLQC